MLRDACPYPNWLIGQTSDRFLIRYSSLVSGVYVRYHANAPTINNIVAVSAVSDITYSHIL